MCVCVVIYICVCEVKIFLPLKKGTIVNAKHKHVSGSHFLSLPLSFSLDSFALSVQIFHFSLFWFEKKKEKKNRIKFLFEKADFSKNPTTFCFSRYYYYVELFSLSCAYTLKRGLEKREKTSAYKSNNNNNKREKERTVLIIRRIDEAEKSRAYTNDDDDDDGSSSRRL
jgi:hypothetical protein